MCPPINSKGVKYLLKVAGNRLRSNVGGKKKPQNNNPAHSIVLKDTEIAKKKKKTKNAQVPLQESSVRVCVLL